MAILTIKTVRERFTVEAKTEQRPQVEVVRCFDAILGLDFNMDALAAGSHGSTMKHIKRGELDSYTIKAPSLAGQQRIAEILSTVDEAIEQTEALIAKTQQIKAGLMHDLFTRGVTPDGQLRPTRKEAPQLYKESPLGWIPKEWGMRPYASISELITVGVVVRPTQYYVEAGVPALRSANVRENGVDQSDLIFISEASNKLLAKSQLRTGDIVSVRTGYPGTSAVVSPCLDGANCIDILISRPTDALRSKFVAAWINSSFGKGQVLRKQGGLAQQHFNVGELRELQVVLPSLAEQDQIVDRLNAINARLETESGIVGKLSEMKQGLMNDLLSGRVDCSQSWSGLLEATS